MVHVSSPLVHDGVYGEDSCFTGVDRGPELSDQVIEVKPKGVEIRGG